MKTDYALLLLKPSDFTGGPCIYSVLLHFINDPNFFYLSTPVGKTDLPHIWKYLILELIYLFIYLFNIPVGF
jgi:hypothetical protein